MKALLAWIAALGAAVVGLIGMGTGPLATPPLSAEGLGAWVAARDAATIAVALVRLAVLAAAAYLLVTTLLVTAARLVGGARAVSVLAAMSLPVTRRIVSGALGATVAAATLIPGSATASPAPPPPASDVPVMQWLPPAGATAQPSEAAAPAPAPPPTPAPTPSAGPPSAVTIAAGGHLWSVAEEVLAEEWGGRRPTDAEIDRFWRALVERNRPNLPDPRNPDLVHPGFVVELPPIPPR